MNNYKKIFRESLDNLKKDGNYRIFADLEKIAGNFPQALNYKDNSVSEVTVWCSNDYLGMSQNDIVIKSMIPRLARKRTMLFTSERSSTFIQFWISCQSSNTFYTWKKITRLRFFFRRKKSCIHDTRNEKLWRKKSNI